jgi:hypothetical protein
MTRSILALMLLGASAVAQEKREKTVILVHGAFADGSSWDKVIQIAKTYGLDSWDQASVHQRISSIR